MNCRTLLASLALLSGTMALWFTPLSAQSERASSGTLNPGFDINALDRSVDPCVDFYHFACGTWLKENPVPPDRAIYGRFSELADRNRQIMREVLEKASVVSSGRSPDEQKIGDYYASCMDEEGIEKKGLAPIEAEIARVNALKGKEGLPRLISHFWLTGTNVLFSFGVQQDAKDSTQQIAIVGQGGLGLPDRDFYFRNDPKSIETRNQYVEHAQKVFELFGESPVDATLHSETIMRFETALAQGALDNVSLRDPNKTYHRMSTDEFRRLSPSFKWADFMAGIGLQSVQSLNVSEPDFIRQMQSVLKSTSMADLKVYLRWRVMNSAALIAAKKIDEEAFRFYGQILSGQKEQQPRWRRCVGATDGDLGEALGKAFVARVFPEESKQRTLQLVNALEKALQQDIRTLPWMTEATKEQALIKLHKIANKIGYPDKWRDYSALEIIRGDALGNSLRSNEFENRRQLSKIGKPVDSGEWLYSPPTVNAYYYPPQNNINFMAGILQPPFYDPQVDEAINFGAIGSVIGHELTHGFDDQGRRYDAQGNLRDWWTAEDEKAFKQRAECEVQQYNDFTVAGAEHVNGKLTLGENTADNGGIRIAFMALMEALAGKTHAKSTIEGFTPEQRFFVGWGQVWCTNATPEALRLQLQTNVHSPGEFRINGPASNFEEFRKAFGCKSGQPMVRSNACRVW